MFGPADAERALATLREHRSGIPAAIRLGRSNGRHEGPTSRIRPISHRAFGFHSPDPLIRLVHVCRSDLMIDLPRRTSPPNPMKRRI